MGMVTEARRKELQRTLPPAAVTRERIRTYIAKADLRQYQFAALMNRSVKGLEQFLGDRYSADDLLFREEAELTMERNPVGVAASAAAGRLYDTESVAVLRRWFEHCHDNRALAFVYAPPGSGKTFIAEHLVAEFNRRELGRGDGNRAYMVRASVNITPRDLLAKICVEVGAMSGTTLQRCMSGLRQRLRGTNTTLILDEMQLADTDAFEALREMHDTEPKLGILLMGSHGLKKFFDSRALELEQWNSRLDAGVELPGMDDSTARAIIGCELADLGSDQADMLLESSRIVDAYSGVRGRKYLSPRRLFKNINALRQLSADAQEATA